MRYLSLAGFLILCFLPAFAGARFRPDPWFAGIRKPSWNPPSWLFAPVWTALYLSMGIAAWLVWIHAGWPLAMWIFIAQLIVNGLWTFLFFGLHSPALALADCAALWLLVAATITSFYIITPLAGLILLPYLAWLTFANALNLSIWRLNISHDQSP